MILPDVGKQVSIFPPWRYLRDSNPPRLSSPAITTYHIHTLPDVRNYAYPTMGNLFFKKVQETQTIKRQNVLMTQLCPFWELTFKFLDE